jgi:hypothetical protein
VQRTILSLFDFSGEWSKPYREAGYKVIQIDKKTGHDVLALRTFMLPVIHGVLAAPPCDHFSSSGARWWPEKDRDGRTAQAVRLVNHTLELIRDCRPKWWALENPVGRIGRFFPLHPYMQKPRLIFDPCDYGDPYTKRTCLWGAFNPELPKTPVEPVMYTTANGKRGSWYWKNLGGKSERTKTLRSQTPGGFARAFFEANP